tara:strand:+ start:2723 stop:3724 length:1002 start_codon:yes stop_codon:yes gene_type:complete
MKKGKRLFILLPLLILLVIISIIHYINFDSMIEQNWLMADYRTGTNLEIDRIIKYRSDFPSINQTTMPIKTMQARYYLRDKKYKQAIALAKEGLKSNPYLFLSEYVISRSYLKLNQLDSAFFYAKKAFYGLPNEVHRNNLFEISEILKDKVELNKAFNLIKKRNKQSDWIAAVVIMSKMKYHKDSIIELIDQAKTIFKDKAFDDFQNIANLGDKNHLEIINRTLLAEQFFKSENYESSIKEYEELLIIDSINKKTYIENIALNYFKSLNYDRALIFYNKLIDESLDNKSGKPEYFKGLILLDRKKKNEGCNFIRISKLKGFLSANAIESNYCN